MKTYLHFYIILSLTFCSLSGYSQERTNIYHRKDFQAPTNLKANIIECPGDGAVELTWDFELVNFLHFNIYRNSLLIDSCTTTQFYMDTIPYYGEFSYTVTAQYSEGESQHSNKSNIRYKEFAPPQPFHVEIQDGLIIIVWNNKIQKTNFYDDIFSCPGGLEGYVLYIDGMLEGFLPEIYYIPVSGFSPGIHILCLSCKYEWGESSETCAIFEITNTDINKLKYKPEIIIYPNPAKDNIYIKSTIEITSTVIFNKLGQKILTLKNTGKNFEINTSAFKPGIYILNLITDKNIITRKIIVE